MALVQKLTKADVKRRRGTLPPLTYVVNLQNTNSSLVVLEVDTLGEIKIRGVEEQSHYLWPGRETSEGWGGGRLPHGQVTGIVRSVIKMWIMGGSLGAWSAGVRCDWPAWVALKQCQATPAARHAPQNNAQSRMIIVLLYFTHSSGSPSFCKYAPV